MNFSSFVIPIVVIIVLFYGIIKKINVYDEFIVGAKESLETILNLFPNLLAMVIGINIFIKSGLLNFILNGFYPVLDFLNIPFSIVPMAIMRPISGSSSFAILNEIFNTYGADSLVGRIGSVLQGSADTTLYVLTIYFGSVGIRKIKYALYVGLISDLIGIFICIAVVKFLF